MNAPAARIDPQTGELIVCWCNLQPPYLTWSSVRADGNGTQPTPVEGVGRPTRIRDMALTEHYIVLLTQPSAEPDSDTRIALVPRNGGPVRWCEDAVWRIGHIAAAYELDDPAAGGPVVIDYVGRRQPHSLIGDPQPGRGRLQRALIDPAAGTLRGTTRAPGCALIGEVGT